MFVCGGSGTTVCLGTLGLDFSELQEALSLEVGHDDFHCEVNDLRGDGEVNDLLTQAGRVDAELVGGGCLELLVVLCEWLDGQAEDVQVRNNDSTEGHVYECRE